MSDERGLGRLRLYNAAMGLLHAVQGVAVLLLSNDFALPVTPSCSATSAVGQRWTTTRLTSNWRPNTDRRASMSHESLLPV